MHVRVSVMEGSAVTHEYLVAPEESLLVETPLAGMGMVELPDGRFWYGFRIEPLIIDLAHQST